MREKRTTYRLLVGNWREKDHQEDKDVGRWIILRWVL
jgi:hypothetical protein